MSQTETHVLFVDDDAALRDLMRVFFEERGMAVTLREDASDLNRVIERERPSIVVLDLMMPGIDGLAALRGLRAGGDNTPLIMLTARAEGVDRIIGLQLGADDYLGKPFMPQELLARIEAVLRRHVAVPGALAQRPARYRFGSFEVDFHTRALLRGGQALRLTSSEFGLLAVLVRHPMETLSRARLLTLWHGAHVDVTERGIDVPIWRLRRLLEDDPAQPRIIQTMRGIGYMFVPPKDDDA